MSLFRESLMQIMGRGRAIIHITRKAKLYRWKAALYIDEIIRHYMLIKPDKTVNTENYWQHFIDF